MIGEDIDGVMLHDAIGKNDAAMAGRLIEGLAPSALVSTNKAGCTPLMLLAMGQCGRADGLRLVRALLDRCAAAGAPTGAALRSHNKRTAAEYARAARQDDATTALLEAAEARARAADAAAGARCCDVCGAALPPRARVTRLAARAAAGEEPCAPLARLFAAGEHEPL